MTIKVMFVDGPTGIGKGFFIDNFKKLYEEKYPHKKVESIVATDFALRGSAKTELRKYTSYQTEEDKVKSIFNGHVDLIDYISDKSKSTDSPDLFIVDRGFLTFLCYNVYKDEEESKRSTYIETFKNKVEELLSEIDVLYVSLDTEIPGITRCVNILLSRISERGDNKEVDIDWLYKLVNNYREFRSEMDSIFTYTEKCSSGDYELIFNRYVK